MTPCDAGQHFSTRVRNTHVSTESKPPERENPATDSLGQQPRSMREFALQGQKDVPTTQLQRPHSLLGNPTRNEQIGLIGSRQDHPLPGPRRAMPRKGHTHSLVCLFAPRSVRKESVAALEPAHTPIIGPARSLLGTGPIREWSA